MSLSKELCKEFQTPPEGIYAPYYFRFLGYRKDFCAPYAIFRANGIESLFTNTKPHIFKNDLIVGNTHCFYCDAAPEILAHAESFVQNVKDRDFKTNKDHFAPDYRDILSKGVPGLIQEIDASTQRHSQEPDKMITLKAMRITMTAFLRMIENYANKAEELLEDPAYDRERLAFIIGNCRPLLTGAPQTFPQALQLVWFCHTAFLLEQRFAMSLGRMDQYLYPFYQRDVDAGTLTKEQAVTLLENVFIKIQNDTVNICIGGSDVNGNCQINEVSYCILHAVMNNGQPWANLSARITEDTPDSFLDDALKSIGTGLGYPALMSDAVNVAAMKHFGYEPEDAHNFCMVGCIENFIPGMQPPWSDGRFDTPRYLDYVFNNGVSPYNKTVGLALGDVDEIQSMDAFLDRLKKQLELGAAEYVSRVYAGSDFINQDYFADPFLSCFCYDCIGRGLDIHNGGAKYPSSHGPCIMGIATLADSLAAIEKVVFMDQEATLGELRDALLHNFEGHDELHQKLLAAPKYGNDDDFVDKYAVMFVSFMSDVFEQYHTRDGGAMCIGMAANTANISAGERIAATPDGRKQGEPLSDAASPTYGRDVKGPTFTINSLTKPDYSTVGLGSVVNQKYSPSMFQGEKRKRMLALIKTYFKKGGQEIQINATSRETLKDAMVHPENYQNLVVRVSGFSEYFVRLDRSVQMDILNRTQHE